MSMSLQDVAGSVATGTLVLLLLVGCASNSPHGPGSGTGDDLHSLENGGIHVTPPYHFNPEIERAQRWFDSALAFYSMGNIDSTLAALDSLELRLDRLSESPMSSKAQNELDALRGSYRELLHAVEEDQGPLFAVDSVGVDYDEISVQTIPEHESPPWPYSIEIVHNASTETWIKYFTTRGGQRFQVWLDRGSEYEEIVGEILQKQGLPRDLMYLPLIESGYNPQARSWANAVGLWQFIAGTGRRYGLRIDWWIDERKDAIASTWAATHYLKFLYEKFESWPLALAAYNCGEYRVERAMRRQGTRDFWVLRLPRQTRNYVPKFMAAVIIAHDPEAYGFERRLSKPLTFDVVEVSHPVDLDLIAERAGLDKAEIKSLNPGLLREVTPPNYKRFELKVPSGRGEVCRTELEQIPPAERVNWVRHKIRRGETLSGIASDYQTSVRAIMSLNNLRSAHRIRAGAILLVPSPKPSTSSSYTARYRSPPNQKVSKATTDPLPGHQPPPGHKEVIYLVKKGDTLGHIAEYFGTRASKLRLWNDLSYRSYIYPGQKIRVFVAESFDEPRLAGSAATGSDLSEASLRKVSYTVKRGDTLYGIGRRYNASVGQLLRWNNRRASQTLYPGEVIVIWIPRSNS